MSVFMPAARMSMHPEEQQRRRSCSRSCSRSSSVCSPQLQQLYFSLADCCSSGWTSAQTQTHSGGRTETHRTAHFTLNKHTRMSLHAQSHKCPCMCT